MRNLSRYLAPVAIAVALAFALVPFAGAATGRSDSTAAATIVKVKAGAPTTFAFTLSTKTLAKPGKVIFEVKNVGKTMHDFKIAGKKTPLLQPGDAAKLSVTFKKKGKYPYVCTVPGHAAAGMKGVFVVK